MGLQAVVEEYPLDQIKIDEEVRQRTAVKDIDQLAASIERDGQLHPITIHEDGALVAGRRRIAALLSLGRTTGRVQIFEKLSYDTRYRI